MEKMLINQRSGNGSLLRQICVVWQKLTHKKERGGGGETQAALKSPPLGQSRKAKEGVLIPFRVDQTIRYGSAFSTIETHQNPIRT